MLKNLLRKVSVLFYELVSKLLLNLWSVESEVKSQQCRDSENCGVKLGEREQGDPEGVSKIAAENLMVITHTASPTKRLFAWVNSTQTGWPLFKESVGSVGWVNSI